jgi:hypothetical protein
MNIKLTLTKHCIEAEVKRLYNQSVLQYFKSGADKDRLEMKIELLKTLLEQADFSYLRRTYPELSGHHHAEVSVLENAVHGIAIIINGKAVDIRCPP